MVGAWDEHYILIWKKHFVSILKYYIDNTHRKRIIRNTKKKITLKKDVIVD